MRTWWESMLGIKNPFAPLVLRYRQWRVNRSIRILDSLDWHMKKAGWGRTKRRQFWRDFIKSHAVREDVFNELTFK